MKDCGICILGTAKVSSEDDREWLRESKLAGHSRSGQRQGREARGGRRERALTRSSGRGHCEHPRDRGEALWPPKTTV